jgi:hypothetical protein
MMLRRDLYEILIRYVRKIEDISVISGEHVKRMEKKNLVKMVMRILHVDMN